MKRFVEGEDRNQSSLFPERLDDYIADDNPVRLLDAFVDELKLLELGFAGVEPSSTGRPAYHPSVLLKIYVYGYLNRIHSSRRLERETQRNVELMWLTGRLMPDFKTIADFRKDNGRAIKNVCRQFVMLCRQMNLFTEAMVAIDGSKFKAVNNRDKNFTSAKMKRRMQQIESSVERYLRQLESTDHDEPSIAQARTERLGDKIEALKEEMQRLKKHEVRMLEAADQQLSLTDPDARSMKTRGTGVVGYNVQVAVDTEHHLIVAHEVTNIGSDRRQLTNMAEQAKSAMGIKKKEKLTVVADRGYYTGEEILACANGNITTYVPNSNTSNNQAKGLYARRSFRYIAKDDVYRCPAGERLTRRTKTHPNGLTVYRYWSSVCGSCSLKSRCTPGKERRVSRWEHEAVLEDLQERMDLDRDKMRLRRSTAEHPFGTLKAWMGWTHFSMKTLDRVGTEMSLHVLAYNMKRMINLFGVKSLLKAIREWAEYLHPYMRSKRRRKFSPAFFKALLGLDPQHLFLATR
jgi:transposase